MVLALVACGGVVTLNDDALEQNIRDEFQSQAGVQLASVECPNDRPLLAGDEFECSATTADGEQLTISVTQTDGAGKVTWELAE